MFKVNLPSENSSQQGRIETLRRGESSLNLSYGDLVLRGWGEEGEPTRSRTENLKRELLVHVFLILMLGLIKLTFNGKRNITWKERFSAHSLKQNSYSLEFWNHGNCTIQKQCVEPNSLWTVETYTVSLDQVDYSKFLISKAKSSGCKNIGS